MAGHSKWNNIKHRKEKTDAQRGKIFTKIGREIAITVREGGADPNANTRLKDLIAKAKANNVPNENIRRMIEKASGGAGSASYEPIIYEGYGPAGVAVLVETLTDNRNRTAGEMRHYFDKYGGNMGAPGSVAWQFDQRGVLIIERGGRDESDVFSDALEAGCEDFSAEDEVFEALTSPADFSAAREALEALGYEFMEAEVQYIPQNYVALTSDEDTKNMQKLIDMMEDNDDVQSVWHNWENS